MDLDHGVYKDVDLVNTEEFKYTYKGFEIVDYKAKLYSLNRIELELKRVEYLYKKSQISYELYMCFKSKLRTVRVCVELEHSNLEGVHDDLYALYESRAVGSFESEYIYKVYTLLHALELRLKNNKLKYSSIYENIIERSLGYVESNVDKEWVYIASNDPILHTGSYKIGMSERNPIIRLEELSNTSVVFGFYPHIILAVNDSLALEKELHRVFSSSRLVRSREYFKLDIKELIDYLDTAHGLGGYYYV